MRLLAQTVRFSSNIASEKRFLKQHSNNCREESVLFFCLKITFRKFVLESQKHCHLGMNLCPIIASFTWEEAIKALLCKQL